MDPILPTNRQRPMAFPATETSLRRDLFRPLYRIQ
ncbi:unnamed protein product [Linum tenue]|uniref:Uncharacterized protein n=1 Tax=Linum tenue TaxID=586396 RepID=A0AAV0HWN0_9ROSI|nr:unnamed protein product [Linum tenue]